MSMIRRDPIDAFMPLRQAIDRLFEESFLWPGRTEFFGTRTFPIDVYESPDKQAYVVEATVAGFKPEEIQITAEAGILTIHAEKKEEKKEEKGGYLRRERIQGEMTRSVTLPGSFDESKIEATYEHGVLTIRAPKAEHAKPKQIPVRIKEVVGAH